MTGMNNNRTNCEKCNCNVYEQIGELNYDTWQIYKRKVQAR